MHQCPEYRLALPEASKAMLHVEQQVHAGGLDSSLLELVKSRASQMNGRNRLNVAFRAEAGNYASPPAAKP